MVVDTSAVVAILLGEPEADRLLQSLIGTVDPMMSAVTRVELSFVLEGRKGSAGRRDIEDFMRGTHIDVIPVTLAHAELAIEAFRRYGRGRHRAALNIGDCFSYALAKATDLPLLYKGDDFGHTDVRPALTP